MDCGPPSASPLASSPGKLLTLKGKGIPRLRGSGRGDQMIVINVEIPTRLNTDQRKLLEQLAENFKEAMSAPKRARFSRLVKRCFKWVDGNQLLEISLIVEDELVEPVSEVLARFVKGGVAIESTAIGSSPDEEGGQPIGPLRASTATSLSMSISKISAKN